ncbi:Plasmodium exported protein, unknown function [Plasmodium gonderi]|uniref:Pv-fam-d protein n=1 Tax=Plasmodium gonderi TaxID=77519 RepID=A0A1Y1JD63_PLAGO|nr:Plasmodium exported protein, unknown function [Plasmodium gonderi]GAW80426.1 Plasmodium exported protein, unknown function [Plasmodium gonderi]
MKEKTNMPFNLSPKVFTFFLLISAWKFPFESCASYKWNRNSEINNTLGMQHGRMLKGEAVVQKKATYSKLKEELVDILEEEDKDLFGKRLNALINDSNYKQQFNILLNNEQLKGLSDFAKINDRIKKQYAPHSEESEDVADVRTLKKPNEISVVENPKQIGKVTDLAKYKNPRIAEEVSKLHQLAKNADDVAKFRKWHKESSISNLDNELRINQDKQKLKNASNKSSYGNKYPIGFDSVDDLESLDLNEDNEDEDDAYKSDLDETDNESCFDIDELKENHDKVVYLDDDGNCISAEEYMINQINEKTERVHKNENIAKHDEQKSEKINPKINPTTSDKQPPKTTYYINNKKVLKGEDLRKYNKTETSNQGNVKSDQKTIHNEKKNNNKQSNSFMRKLLRRIDSKIELEMLRYLNIQSKGQNNNSQKSQNKVLKSFKIMNKYRVFSPLVALGIFSLMLSARYYYMEYFTSSPIFSIILHILVYGLYALLALYYVAKLAKMTRVKRNLEKSNEKKKLENSKTK